ncbi:hypothetical protein JAAARDRAFT_40371 [Jaapia argillacea MUCL 33604]|uniref:Uncharacterized protein n=1 Tax=Jaapia argillacea MUCL 33604 TaxID=933084 RepID=A0A067PPK0_9AGAM|nr:hypothetical protein JAAARDRAFT_40371 [Jaapia argillacea MUCL 33604]
MPSSRDRYAASESPKTRISFILSCVIASGSEEVGIAKAWGSKTCFGSPCEFVQLRVEKKNVTSTGSHATTSSGR